MKTGNIQRGGERSRTEEDFFTTDNTDKGADGGIGKPFISFLLSVISLPAVAGRAEP